MQKQTLGEWNTEQSFDGQLCQKYSYQKLLKLDTAFSSDKINIVQDVFFPDTVYISAMQQVFFCHHSFNI